MSTLNLLKKKKKELQIMAYVKLIIGLKLM